MDRKEISFQIARRLKSLREDKGLSYQKLKDAIFERYGLEVSIDSLRDYEIENDFRSKSVKLPNMGMRLEYLYVFSDFYGVSTDYILGLSEYKNFDLRGITAENLGLSDQAATVQFNLWNKLLETNHTEEEKARAIENGAIWPYYSTIRTEFLGNRDRYFSILKSVARYVAKSVAVKDAQTISAFPATPVGYPHEFQSEEQRNDFLERNYPMSRSYDAFNLQNAIMRFIEDSADKIAEETLKKK